MNYQGYKRLILTACAMMTAVVGVRAGSSFYFSNVQAESAVTETSVQEAKRQFLEEGRNKSYALYAGVTKALRDANIKASKKELKRVRVERESLTETAEVVEEEPVAGAVMTEEPVAEVVTEEPVTKVAEEEPVADTYIDVNGDVWELDADKPLLASAVTDSDYVSEPLSLSSVDRDLFERLVQGEAGNEGFAGAAIVAQSIRDNMIDNDVYDVAAIKRMLTYTGSTSKRPCEDVKQACSFILDKGGMAVQHRVLYFYAPKWTDGHYSSFHERQVFLIEWGGHRVFDRKE